MRYIIVNKDVPKDPCLRGEFGDARYLGTRGWYDTIGRAGPFDGAGAAEQAMAEVAAERAKSGLASVHMHIVPLCPKHCASPRGPDEAMRRALADLAAARSERDEAWKLVHERARKLDDLRRILSAIKGEPTEEAARRVVQERDWHHADNQSKGRVLDKIRAALEAGPSEGLADCATRLRRRCNDAIELQERLVARYETKPAASLVLTAGDIWEWVDPVKAGANCGQRVGWPLFVRETFESPEGQPVARVSLVGGLAEWRRECTEGLRLIERGGKPYTGPQS